MDEQSFLRRTLGRLGGRGVGLVRQALNSITLNDPTDFILLLVASAVAGGASFIAVQSDTLDFTMEFDGRPMTPQQLQDMYAGTELCTVDLQTRKLALGLTAAFSTGVDSVQVETWSGTAGVRLNLTPTGQTSQAIRVCPMSAPGATMRVRLAERAKLRMVTKVVTRFQNSHTLPELDVLQERCLHAGPSITVNRLRINQSVDLGPCFSWRLLRAEPPMAALELTGVRPKRGFIAEKASPGPFCAVLALGSRFSETRGLRLVAGGILVKVTQPLVFRNASVVAAAFGLESDVTNSQAILNDTATHLIEFINRELMDMGLELYRERARVQADELEVAASLLEDLSAQWELEGRVEGAQEALAACLEFRVRHQGPLHPELLPAMERLSELCQRSGQDERLHDLIGQQIPILREQARNHLLKHRCAEAVACLQRALDLEERLPDSASSPGFAQRYHELAVLMKENRLAGSESLFLRAVALQEGQPGAPGQSMESLRELADRYRVSKQFDEAESTARKALAMAEEVLGPNDPGLIPYLKLLGEVLKSSGRYGESTDFESRAVMLRFRRTKS